MTKSLKSKAKDPNRTKQQPASEYDVGYCKPPKHAQFKQGQSGNPAGRKKGINNFATDVKRSLSTPVEIIRDGKVRKVSSQEASIMRLREKALKGETRSLEFFVGLARQYNGEELEKAMETAGIDAEIMKVFAQRVQSGAYDMPDDTPSLDDNPAEDDTP
jgi:Family of unknown function (DUF5681)